MTNPRDIDPERLDTARRVLNDDQYLTWAMAEVGISRQAIADYRRRSKGTINDTIRRARRIVEEALDGTHPQP